MAKIFAIGEAVVTTMVSEVDGKAGFSDRGSTSVTSTLRSSSRGAKSNTTGKPYLGLLSTPDDTFSVSFEMFKITLAEIIKIF